MLSSQKSWYLTKWHDEPRRQMRSNRYIVSLDEIEVAVGLRFAKIRYDTLIDAETAVSRLIELVKTRIPRRFRLDPIREVQVLCPMNRGGVGARSLNIELQAALNPPATAG
jgi:hypothetical protein